MNSSKPNIGQLEYVNNFILNELHNVALFLFDSYMYVNNLNLNL